MVCCCHLMMLLSSVGLQCLERKQRCHRAARQIEIIRYPNRYLSTKRVNSHLKLRASVWKESQNFIRALGWRSKYPHDSRSLIRSITKQKTLCRRYPSGPSLAFSSIATKLPRSLLHSSITLIFTSALALTSRPFQIKTHLVLSFQNLKSSFLATSHFPNKTIRNLRCL